MGLTVIPGDFMSTRKNDMPSCFFACAFVRARTKIQSAYWAMVVQVFWPEIAQPSPSRRAVVRRLARADPAPGSEKPWHHHSLKSTIGGRNRSFCFWEPKV